MSHMSVCMRLCVFYIHLDGLLMMCETGLHHAFGTLALSPQVHERLPLQNLLYPVESTNILWSHLL